MAKKGREEVEERPIVDIDDELREYMATNAPKGGYALPTGYLSNAQVEMYLRCPKQYEFRYIRGDMRPPGVAMAMGSSTHKAVEVTHHHIVDHDEPAPAEQVIAAFSDTFEKRAKEVPEADWTEEGVHQGAIKDAGIQLVSMYNRIFAPKVKPQVKGTVRGIEKKFEIVIEGIPMVGYIDLIDTNADAIMTDEERQLLRQYGKDVPEVFRTAIADFKTRSKSISEDEVKGSLQLTLYSYAEGISLVRYDQLLRQKQPKVKRIHSMRATTDHQWMVKVVTDVARAITAGIFPPCNPTNWCCSAKWCGFWSQCRGRKV